MAPTKQQEKLLNVLPLSWPLIPFGGAVSRFLVATGSEITFRNWRGRGSRGDEIKAGPGSKPDLEVGAEPSTPVGRLFLVLSLINTRAPEPGLRAAQRPDLNNKEGREEST